MIILGIETSCDETAAAVLNEEKLLSNIVYSQTAIHQSFGGVVPELAARAHLQTIIPTIEEALKQASITKNQLEAIAVTCGPGLIGALLVGVNVAKTLAFAQKIPLIGVNHLEGHICAIRLDYPDFKPPGIILLVSGGHTLLILVEDWSNYQVLGQSIDDAAGEAFDKVAKMMTLGYPGGPVIDNYAKQGDPEFYSFPRALMKKKNYNFSFSGLKTAVLYYINSQKEKFVREHVPDICASFQKALTDVLIEKTIRAAKENGIEQVAFVGGVASNEFLRKEASTRAKTEKLRFFFPSLDFCTDNAAMIGRTGFYYLSKGQKTSLSLEANPNLKLGVPLQ